MATRRDILGVTGAAVLAAAMPALPAKAEDVPMYGLIGSMKASPGQRDALVAILLGSISGMPGCLSYVVAEDPEDSDTIWITEVWDSEASHKASLALPQVQEATHGLDGEAIERALATFDGDWTEVARGLVRRRFGERGPCDLRERRRAADLLLRRGFDGDAVRAATRFDPDDPEP